MATVRMKTKMNTATKKHLIYAATVASLMAPLSVLADDDLLQDDMSTTKNDVITSVVPSDPNSELAAAQVAPEETTTTTAPQLADVPVGTPAEKKSGEINRVQSESPCGCNSMIID